jgi:hypothetical protein
VSKTVTDRRPDGQTRSSRTSPTGSRCSARRSFGTADPFEYFGPGGQVPVNLEALVTRARSYRLPPLAATYGRSARPPNISISSARSASTDRSVIATCRFWTARVTIGPMAGSILRSDQAPMRAFMSLGHTPPLLLYGMLGACQPRIDARGGPVIAYAIGAIATIGYLLALASGPAAVIVPLVATSPALAGFLGIAILRESATRRKVLTSPSRSPAPSYYQWADVCTGSPCADMPARRDASAPPGSGYFVSCPLPAPPGCAVVCTFT